MEVISSRDDVKTSKYRQFINILLFETKDINF